MNTALAFADIASASPANLMIHYKRRQKIRSHWSSAYARSARQYDMVSVLRYCDIGKTKIGVIYQLVYK